MPEEIPVTSILVLLSVNVGLVVILLLVVLGLRGKINRLEQVLGSRKKEEPVGKEKSASGKSSAQAEPVLGETHESNTWDVSPGGPFDRFLSEDPARRNLPKKEQSVAYRKWRQQNGLNWSNS